MDKDIKNLEEIINLCKEEINNNDKNITATLDLEDLKSLKNLLTGYKELEEENKQLEAIKDEAIRRYNFESIPTSLVKEKIEELNKKEQELQNSISDEEREEYSDASISFDLMDIEIRRSVLQDLLREE